MNLKIDEAISRGIKLLCKEQTFSGNFLSQTSSDPKNFSHGKKCDSVFSTAIILLCIKDIDNNKQIRSIRNKAIKFLLGQASKNWSYNYWRRGSRQFKTMPYPDDLDDTFCSLAAIYKKDKKLLDGKAMAAITSLLIGCEAKIGGPYRTWIVGNKAPKIWKDIDLAVNSNIGFFLSLQNISLPSIDKLIDDAIKTGNISSPYYPTLYPIIYFFSRFYKGKRRCQIIDYILKTQDKEFSYNKNPLDTAIAVSSLINLGYKKNLEENIKFMLNHKWSAYPLYTGIVPGSKKEKHYAGSRALTSAFCIEALDKYRKLSVKKKFIQPEFAIINAKIKAKTLQTLSRILPQIKAEKFLDEFLKYDRDNQVVLLPAFFAHSLNTKSIEKNFLIKLGFANLLGWIAYTIYDNFIDEEGEIEKLPIANLCLRELASIYRSLFPDQFFYENYFQKIMDGIEKSNNWEIANCRLKKKGEGPFAINKLPNFSDYSILADRSFGHALGPLAILHKLNFKPNSCEVIYAKKYFKHYLIARQLMDDAHDWKDDLNKGQINSSSALIFKKRAKKTVDQSDLRKLEEIFWHNISPKIFNEILFNLKIAKDSLDKIDALEDMSTLKVLLEKIEKAANEGISERKKTLQFLKEIKF